MDSERPTVAADLLSGMRQRYVAWRITDRFADALEHCEVPLYEVARKVFEAQAENASGVDD